MFVERSGLCKTSVNIETRYFMTTQPEGLTRITFVLIAGRESDMSTFNGTIDEYVRMIGPRLRNIIQAKTKPRKRDLDHVCEKCGERRELESIHDVGRERVEIIREFMAKHADANGEVTINLEFAEEQLVRENIASIVGFWCHECHAKVDPKVGRYGKSMPMPGTCRNA